MLQLTNVKTLIYRGTAEALHLACVFFLRAVLSIGSQSN